MEIQKVDSLAPHTAQSLAVGKIFRHYKGNLYKILALARHSEDPAMIMVVYQGLYDCATFGKNPVWCRPCDMFTELVSIDGRLQPRFTEVID